MNWDRVDFVAPLQDVTISCHPYIVQAKVFKHTYLNRKHIFDVIQDCVEIVLS